MSLTPAEKLVAKLAAQQQDEARAIAERKKALERSQAKDRDLKRQLRDARRMVVGTLADEAGLCATDTATLAQGFALLARLIRRGSLAKVSADVHEWDTWEEQEMQARIDGNGTLVVTADAGVPLSHGKD